MSACGKWHRPNEYDEWLDTLGHDAVAEIIAVVSLLRQYGPHLSRPHADTLKADKLYAAHLRKR